MTATMTPRALAAYLGVTYRAAIARAPGWGIRRVQSDRRTILYLTADVLRVFPEPHQKPQPKDKP